MICTNATIKECLDLNLFGDKEQSLPYFREVKRGDIGFLLNISDDTLTGIFRAISSPQLDIMRDAWNGKFRAQIRVEPDGKIQQLNGASSLFQKIGIQLVQLPQWQRPVPRFKVHNSETTERILAHFRTSGLDPRSTPSEIKNSVVTSTDQKLKFDDVIGLENAKKFIIDRMVKPIMDLERAEQYYLRMGGGVLLYGPPGTGKTLIAQSTAAEIDAQFNELSPSIVRGYPGDPEKKIEELFQNMFSSTRSVLFIDEAEALLGSRNNQSSSVMQRITPVLLSQFNKLSRHRHSPVLIIAATNLPWDIDQAFLRPGRLDKALFVGLPAHNDRVSLIKRFLDKRSEVVDKDMYRAEKLDKLADALDGYSGADIEQIIDEAALEAFNKKGEISYQMIEEKIRSNEPSVTADLLEKYQRWENSFHSC